MDATGCRTHSVISRAWHTATPDLRNLRPSSSRSQCSTVPAGPDYSLWKPLPPQKIDEKIRRKVCANWARLHTAFHTIDQDCSGWLNKKEFRKCLDRFCVVLPDKDFDELFKRIDTNRNGRLEWKEFMEFFAADGAKAGADTKFSETANEVERRIKTRYMPPQSLMARVRVLINQNSAQLCKALEVLDQDQTGELDKSELRRLMDRYALPMSDPQFERFAGELLAPGQETIPYKSLLKFFNVFPSKSLAQTMNRIDKMSKRRRDPRRRTKMEGYSVRGSTPHSLIYSR